MYGPSQGSTGHELVLNFPMQTNREKVYRYKSLENAWIRILKLIFAISLCRGSEEVVGKHFTISTNKLPILYEVAPDVSTVY